MNKNQDAKIRFPPNAKFPFFLGMLVVSSSLCKSQSASPIANLPQSCKIKEKQLQSKQPWGFIFPFLSSSLVSLKEKKEMVVVQYPWISKLQSPSASSLSRIQ